MFAARQPQRRVVALARHQLGAPVPAARTSWAPLPGFISIGVHHGTEGDLGQRQRVAGPDLGAAARHQAVAHAHTLGRQDVALLAVGVVQQRDVRRAVRVVLDGRDLGGNAGLLAPEVDLAVAALVAAAPVPEVMRPFDVAATASW